LDVDVIVVLAATIFIGVGDGGQGGHVFL